MSTSHDNDPGAIPSLGQLTSVPEEELAVEMPEIRVNNRQLDDVMAQL